MFQFTCVSEIRFFLSNKTCCEIEQYKNKKGFDGVLLCDSSNSCKNLKEFSLVKSCILFWETVKLYEVENVEFVQKF